jgi:hypothetical protein
LVWHKVTGPQEMHARVDISNYFPLTPDGGAQADLFSGAP